MSPHPVEPDGAAPAPDAAGPGSGSGGTAWPRFALALAPAAALAAILVTAVGEGGVAASLAVSGRQFKVSADSLVGHGFAQYGSAVVTADGERHPVLLSVIGRAELTGLCQSMLMPTPVGPVTFLVRAGAAGRPVQATNLVIDLRQLTGDATFADLRIGRDASTLDLPPGLGGKPGQMGQEARTVRVTDLKQTAYAVNAGTFTLNDLRLSVRPGDHECF